MSEASISVKPRRFMKRNLKFKSPSRGEWRGRKGLASILLTGSTSKRLSDPSIQTKDLSTDCTRRLLENTTIKDLKFLHEHTHTQIMAERNSIQIIKFKHERWLDANKCKVSQ